MTALRILAQRRLSEAQLWSRLERRGYDEDEVRGAVASVKRDGLLDDTLLATLHVASTRKAVGNRRLVAELVRKGVDRETAAGAVTRSECSEAERIAAADAKIRRANPQLADAAVARKLERLGFPASLIYRVLRERARDAVPELADLA